MSNKLVTQLVVSRSETESESDSEREKRKNQLNSNRNAEGFHSYLVYSCKFFLAGVNFYRFNAKNWHFRQILREKVAFFTDLTRKIGVFWV